MDKEKTNATTFIAPSQDDLTERQREACVLMEQGRAEEASAVLDMEAILWDAACEEKSGEKAKGCLSRRVAELMLKADIEKTLTGDPERIDRIKRIYEAAVELEERNGLKKKAMCAYWVFLQDQREIWQSLYWQERYYTYMKTEGTEAEKAEASNGLGCLYGLKGPWTEAEHEFLQAKKIYEQLDDENPGVYQRKLARVCGHLGDGYMSAERLEEAEAAFVQAKEIYERLPPGGSLNLRLGLVMTCRSLGILYRKTGRLKEAETELLRVKEIREENAAKYPQLLMPHLAMACGELGSLYELAGCPEKAERVYLQAKEVYEQLNVRKAGGYLAHLTILCEKLRTLYSERLNDPERAEEMAALIKTLEEKSEEGSDSEDS